MGLKVAVANGNWSNPATWSASILPLPEDVVATNGFTITLDQSITALELTNTAKSYTSVIPAMTGYTTPSGIVTASDAGYGNNPFTVFSIPAPASGEPGGWTTYVAGPQWVAYEFTSSQIIKVYMVGAQDSGLAPKNWTFEAWNGSSWVVLDTQVNQVFTTATLTYNITNTTAYSKYRLFVSLRKDGANGNFSMKSLRMFTSVSYMQNAAAGGGFILNSGITVTTTGETGLSAGSTDLITFSSSGSATINSGTGNILRPTSQAAISTIKVTGGGTLNITGNLEPANSVATSRNLHITTTAGAVVNVTGRVYGGTSNAILTDVSCTLTVIGNVLGSTTNGPVAGIYFNAGGTLNVTGNVYGSFGFNNNGYGIYFNIGTLNITGNVYGGENQGFNSLGISIVGIATVYITGNLFASNSSSLNNAPAVNSSSASYINQVGAIYAGRNSVGFVSSSSTAINLLTGPFVCNEYGFFAYQIVRMHLIPSTSSYFEFRDETTNGAIQPGAIAPATRLVSPATLVDNLAVSDVRFGTTYALGTLTGTLRMPSANQVTFGIPVDNTFGNAVLTAASVWDYLISNITVENSIGMRLKNVATPQSVGEQLEAFLRLD
jgi:hypothetical protein